MTQPAQTTAKSHERSQAQVRAPLTELSATAVPLVRDNIDTDQILPARFLRKERGGEPGYAPYLFADVRTAPGANDPFPLDDPRFAGAQILLGGANFGCGSSREGAVYALVDSGIRAAIAPSFGDIFYGNAARNGLLCVPLPAEAVEALAQLLQAAPDTLVRIDLPAQTVAWPGQSPLSFSIDAFAKTLLTEGTDEIGLTLGLADRIAAFSAQAAADRPWIVPRRI